MSVHFLTSPLCEALCGLTVEVEGQAVTQIRGDPDDPLSRGFLCPKALALKDIHEDPDRLRHPLRRQGEGWSEVGWDEAFAETADRLHAVRAQVPPSAPIIRGRTLRTPPKICWDLEGSWLKPSPQQKV